MYRTGWHNSCDSVGRSDLMLNPSEQLWPNCRGGIFCKHRAMHSAAWICERGTDGVRPVQPNSCIGSVNG
jgi:hypothetical protein